VNEMGSLSGCVLENDPAMQEQARWLRGKSLVASLTLEATILAMLVIWPLIHLGVLGDRLVVTPVPPYHGGASTAKQPRLPDHGSPANSEAIRLCLVCAAASVPSHPQISDNGEGRSSIVAGLGDAPDVGDGEGPVIPSVDGRGAMPLEIKKPPAPQHVAHIGEGVMEAALIHKVQPVYPMMARLSHVSGTVRMRALIGTDGKIRELEVLSGNPLFQGAAVAAVREWRYRPTLLNGEAVEVETLITVNFVMDQQ
jgi:protein TonB